MSAKELQIPRLMIAGTHSGVGKTTITTAVMAALAQKGLNVQPYKIGPDYIDPSYHTVATGNRCRNLDAWMLDEQTVYRIFVHGSATADISVIEGVMGVFDGSSGSGEEGSSAHIAKLLKCPVILIVDVRSMARSAAAVVLGFRHFDPGLNLAGVILNRIGSDRHLKLVTEAIETYCHVPVVGYIRKNANLELPARHLGLIPTVEGGALPGRIGALAREISEGIDLELLLDIARSAEKMTVADILRHPDAAGPGRRESTAGRARVRIGIAWDAAFSFYYRDGLEALEDQGAELVPFSPLSDADLPENLGGLYIGGGFPEMFLPDLAANRSLMDRIRRAGQVGMPVFAECGGLMYLSQAIVDFDGRVYPMVGLVPGRCIMEKKLAGMGYVEAELLDDSIIAPAGRRLKGHEFHYSRLEPDISGFCYAFRLDRNRYRATVVDGYNHNNILASYVHLHFAADPDLAGRFVGFCRKYKNERG